MDYHSHSAQDVGAAPDGHHHSAYDVGAAEDNHTHYPHEAGASPEGHEHQLHQVAGAASERQLDDLQRDFQSQGRQHWERLTSVEDSIRALQTRNSELQAHLEAERAANAALCSGAVTIPALVQVLREQSVLAESWEVDLPISYALANLADAIEREAR